jgi:hypothetical protein
VVKKLEVKRLETTRPDSYCPVFYIKTKIATHQLYREIMTAAPWLAYETFQDFIDHVIRLGVFELQEGIVARNETIGKTK